MPGRTIPVPWQGRKRTVHPWGVRESRVRSAYPGLPHMTAAASGGAKRARAQIRYATAFISFDAVAISVGTGEGRILAPAASADAA